MPLLHHFLRIQTEPIASDPAASSRSLPRNWGEIDINQLVLAQDDSPWGTWWEAIPVEKAGDVFKLRWRDNQAKVPPVTRQRFELR